jgi:hypothetical protein
MIAWVYSGSQPHHRVEDLVLKRTTSYPAPPLTLDAALEVVKTVKSWRKLARMLMGLRDFILNDGRKKLDAIERQHISDEARLKAVVEAFLLGESEYQPSWRMLIHALHKAGETDIAEKIKTNAEPQQGEWVCTIPQCMHNTSHMTSISNPVFFPSADYAHALGPGLATI